MASIISLNASPWQPDLWVSLFDEEPASFHNEPLSHEQLIRAIDEFTFEEFNAKFASITCSKFAHPDILYHLICKMTKFREEDPLKNYKFIVFLSNILMAAVEESTLETLQRFLELRLSVMSGNIEHKNAKKMKKNDHLNLLLNQLTTDERSEVYRNLLLYLMRWAALSPVEVVAFLINAAMTRPTLIPPISQMLTKQLRPIVIHKIDNSSSPLIISLFNFHLFHSSKNTICQSKYNSCFVHFVKEFFKARYLRNQSCIINLESMVIEWISVAKTAPSSILTQIDVLNQLIESNLGGKLLWPNINLLHLLLYFVTCLITLRRQANVKEVFLSTVDSIMRRHIQRTITKEEIDQLFNLIKPEDTVLLVYFDEYCDDFHISRMLHASHPRVNKYQLVMMACVSQKVSVASGNLPPCESLTEAVELMVPFMTKDEIKKIFHFLLRHYSTHEAIEMFISAVVRLLRDETNSIEKTIDHTYLVSSIDLAVRSCFIFTNVLVQAKEKTGRNDALDCNQNNLFDGRNVSTEKISCTSYLPRESDNRLNGQIAENECKLISQQVERLLNVVPVDCRAIVLQLEKDLSG